MPRHRARPRCLLVVDGDERLRFARVGSHRSRGRGDRHRDVEGHLPQDVRPRGLAGRRRSTGVGASWSCAATSAPTTARCSTRKGRVRRWCRRPSFSPTCRSPGPERFAMLTGTVPVEGGVRPASQFRGELHDPATGRTHHARATASTHSAPPMRRIAKRGLDAHRERSTSSRFATGAM